MQDLPSCDKSHTKRRLAVAKGLVFEMDKDFRTILRDGSGPMLMTKPVCRRRAVGDWSDTRPPCAKGGSRGMEAMRRNLTTADDGPL